MTIVFLITTVFFATAAYLFAGEGGVWMLAASAAFSFLALCTFILFALGLTFFCWERSWERRNRTETLKDGTARPG